MARKKLEWMTLEIGSIVEIPWNTKLDVKFEAWGRVLCPEATLRGEKVKFLPNPRNTNYYE